MTTPPPTTRRATTGDRDALVETLAAAFWDDPVQEWLFPDEARRGGRLRGAFRAELAWFLTLGCTHVTDDLGSVAVWSPPHQHRIPPRAKLRLLVAFRSLWGPRGATALRFLNAMERKHPKEPHWYLALLGTAPQHQGRGGGGAVLAPVLARCDDEGVGAYLESSKEANLAFYGRHGFELTEVLEVDGAPPLWLMWREPRPR